MTYVSSLYGMIANSTENGDPFRIHCDKVVDGKVFGVWLVGGPNSGVGEWVEFDKLKNLRKGN